MVFFLGVTDLTERGTGGRLGRFRQGIHTIRHFVDPRPLVSGVGKDLGEGAPEPESTVADGEHRCPDARRLRSLSTSAQDSVDSRCPSDSPPGAGAHFESVTSIEEFDFSYKG